MYKFELDACGDLDTLPEQILNATIDTDVVYMRLITLNGPTGYPVVEIASEDRIAMEAVLEDVWGCEKEDIDEMIRRQELAGITGVVTLPASVHVAVQDGEVIAVTILPTQSEHDFALYEGDFRAVQVARTTTWKPLLELPAAVRWEG